MHIKKILDILKYGVDKEKNKRDFLKAMKKYIIKKEADSVMYKNEKKINILVVKGIIKLIEESRGVRYYQIINKGRPTDMVFIIRENTGKIIPVNSVSTLKQYTISEGNGNFVINVDGKTVCIEKLILKLYTGRSLDELMKMEVHHKWFRFVALPGMIIPLKKWDHMMGHARTGRYGRNQSVVFNPYEFEEFIMNILKYRKIMVEIYFYIICCVRKTVGRTGRGIKEVGRKRMLFKES